MASPIPIMHDMHRGDCDLPIAALSLLAAAHLFDYVTFIVMTSRHGLAAEINPVVIKVAQDYGLPGLTLAKAATVIFLSISVILLARQHRRGTASVLLIIGIAAGIFGGLTNIAST
jgi:hypothetical protein